jgi:hypothetical protein
MLYSLIVACEFRLKDSVPFGKLPERHFKYKCAMKFESVPVGSSSGNCHSLFRKDPCVLAGRGLIRIKLRL